MPPNVTSTATLTCSFGLAPSTLSVLPTNRVMVEGKPAATIQDMLSVVNIPPFGMCTTPTNPAVAAATSAALGVLTPAPCMPMVSGPWTPGAPLTQIGGMPALTAGSTCMCAWAGVITITNPGSVKTTSN
jgi:uncharacterized Zn-binding protein involved in type VI secretion